MMHSQRRGRGRIARQLGPEPESLCQRHHQPHTRELSSAYLSHFLEEKELKTAFCLLRCSGPAVRFRFSEKN